jgi:hypothetical protein
MTRADFPARIRILIADLGLDRGALINAWGFEPFGADYNAWVAAVDAELAKTAEPIKLVFGQKPGKR